MTDVPHDKRDQLEKVVSGLLEGEELYAVYDCVGAGTGFIGLTDRRLVLQDNSFVGRKVAVTSVPYSQVRSVSMVANKSWAGGFFSTSSIAIDLGGPSTRPSSAASPRPSTCTTSSSGRSRADARTPTTAGSAQPEAFAVDVEQGAQPRHHPREVAHDVARAGDRHLPTPVGADHLRTTAPDAQSRASSRSTGMAVTSSRSAPGSPGESAAVELEHPRVLVAVVRVAAHRAVEHERFTRRVGLRQGAAQPARGRRAQVDQPDHEVEEEVEHGRERSGAGSTPRRRPARQPHRGRDGCGPTRATWWPGRTESRRRRQLDTLPQ